MELNILCIEPYASIQYFHAVSMYGSGMKSYGSPHETVLKSTLVM